MGKEKLISLLNTYKDFPGNVLSFVNQGKIEIWKKKDTSNNTSTYKIRMEYSNGKAKEYNSNIYDILKKYEIITFIHIMNKRNQKHWVSIYLDAEELNILYMIYSTNENLAPGLYIPGGAV